MNHDDKPTDISTENTSHTTAAPKQLSQQAFGFLFLQAISFIFAWTTNIWIAKRLGPEVLGQYEICWNIVSFAQILAHSGLSTALIRASQEPDDGVFRTISRIQVLIGTTLAFFIIVLSIQILTQYHIDIHLQIPLQILAFVAIISPMRTYAQTKLERKFLFTECAKIDLLQMISRQVFCILLILNDYTVLSLVYANVLSFICSFFGYQYLLRKYQLHGHGKIDFGLSVPILKTGMALFVGSLLNTLRDNVFSLVMSRMLSSKAVGFYSFGLRYLQVPQLFSTLLGRFTQRFFALYKQNKEDSITAFIFVVRFMIHISLATNLFLLMIAPDILAAKTSDGETTAHEWSQILVYLPIQAIAILIGSINTQIGIFSNTIGHAVRSIYSNSISLFAVLFGLVIIYFLPLQDYQHKTYAILAVFTVNTVLSMLISLYFSIKSTNTKILSGVSVPLVNSMLILFSTLLTIQIDNPFERYGLIAFYFVYYILCIYIFDRSYWSHDISKIQYGWQFLVSFWSKMTKRSQQK